MLFSGLGFGAGSGAGPDQRSGLGLTIVRPKPLCGGRNAYFRCAGEIRIQHMVWTLQFNIVIETNFALGLVMTVSR